MPKDSRSWFISKEFCTWKWGNNPANDEYTSQRCEIFTNHYGRDLETMKRLAEIAKADFPHLQDSDIEFGVYGGSFKKGIACIAFDPGKHPLPADYRVVIGFETKLC